MFTFNHNGSQDHFFGGYPFAALGLILYESMISGVRCLIPEKEFSKKKFIFQIKVFTSYIHHIIHKRSNFDGKVYFNFIAINIENSLCLLFYKVKN